MTPIQLIIMIVSRFSLFYSIDSLLEYEFDTKESIELYKSYLITDIHQKHSSKNTACVGNDSLYESRFFLWFDSVHGLSHWKALFKDIEIPATNTDQSSSHLYEYIPLPPSPESIMKELSDEQKQEQQDSPPKISPIKNRKRSSSKDTTELNDIINITLNTSTSINSSIQHNEQLKEKVWIHSFFWSVDALLYECWNHCWLQSSLWITLSSIQSIISYFLFYKGIVFVLLYYRWPSYDDGEAEPIYGFIYCIFLILLWVLGGHITVENHLQCILFPLLLED